MILAQVQELYLLAQLRYLNPSRTTVWKVRQIQGSAQFLCAYMRSKLTYRGICQVCNRELRFQE